MPQKKKVVKKVKKVAKVNKVKRVIKKKPVRKPLPLVTPKATEQMVDVYVENDKVYTLDGKPFNVASETPINIVEKPANLVTQPENNPPEAA